MVLSLFCGVFRLKIEAFEDIKDGPFVVTAEDIITVPHEYGARWCENGWAKDVTGVVPTGRREVMGVKLVPTPSVHVAGASEV